MLIRNLTIHNFQSYYDTTSIDFGRGLNLIVGNGGKGKSKLFNAFYWVLFGNIYITELGWCSTDGLPHSAKNVMKRHEFINKKALHECSVGGDVKCYVKLELKDDRSNIYTIERTVNATRTDDPNWDWDSGFAWDVPSNMLRITFESETGTRVLHDYMADDKIRELFPTGILGYIWFQGETLDNLINFRKPENLKNAVKHISYFPYYEKLTSIISSARVKIERAERNHLKESNKQNTEAKNLLSDIDNLHRKIEKEEENKRTIGSHIEQIQMVLAADESKVSGLAKYSELVRRYDELEIEMNKLRNEMTNLDNEERRLLPNLWVLRGTDKLIEKSKEIINSHVEKEYTAPERKYLDNPGKTKLEEILYKSHQCFVCGSLVDDEHPDTRDWILNRLKMQEEYLIEVEEFKSNLEFSKRFNMLLGKIQDYPDSLLIPIGSIDKQYVAIEDQISRIQAKLRKINENKDKLDEQIEEIKRKNGVDPRRQATEFTTIDRTIKASRSNLEREQKKYRACEEAIKELIAAKKAKEKEYAKYGAATGVVTAVEETEWNQISTVLEKICKSVQEKARKELLRNIETRTNEFYKSFTEHDKGYKGRVEIGDDYSIIYDAGLNTSHEDRKKMSIINALLSLNQEALGTYYPFISDAPTSSFDPSTTHKYLLGIKDIFHQSIIMTKDVEIGSSNYRELFGNDRVSRIYQLSSHIYKEGDGEPEIYEVSTNVECLK